MIDYNDTGKGKLRYKIQCASFSRDGAVVMPHTAVVMSLADVARDLRETTGTAYCRWVMIWSVLPLVRCPAGFKRTTWSLLDAAGR